MNELLHLDRTIRPLRRRLAAIAFLDVVGYSRLVAVNEEGTLNAWSSLRNNVIEPRIISYRGRIVDRAGDGIFSEFGSALEALHWAVDVQNAARRQFDGADPIKLRIAVHLADVIDGPDGEVQGDGVNTAARLQTHAEAGGAIVSQTVVDAVLGKTDAVFEDLGLLKLRNIAHPLHAFRLSVAPGVPLVPWLPSPTRIVIGAIALLLVLLAPLLHWGKSPRETAELLLQQGLAIKCQVFPCGRQWLQQRELFERAIALDSTFARPYAEAAFTYTKFVSSRISADPNEDLRIAGNLASRAVALAPDQAFAHSARGAVLRQNPDKLEEALSAHLRVLSIDPGDAAARANAGWILLLLGRPAEAEPYVRAAINAQPKNASVAYWFNRLGLIDLFLNRDGHGADFFRRAIKLQSSEDSTGDVGLERAINLAAALALSGDTEAARELTDRLRVQYPSLSVHNIWTCACSHAPRFEDAMERLRQGAVLAGVSDNN